MMPTVSIIIPVYNANKALLDNCIRSIVSQTYQNVEIIIVNDGSTDYAPEYYNSYLSMDSRIKLINQSNQGVSEARNRGTLEAVGDYVMYVDGDDVLAPIAVQEGVKCILESQADIAIAAIEKISSHTEFSNPNMFSGRYECIVGKRFDSLREHYVSLDKAKFININGNGYINRGPYCRLIKKRIAVENPFPKGLSIGEDLLWNMSLISKCNSICIIFNIWYGYLISGTSAIRKYYGNRREKVEEYLTILWQENLEFFENNHETYIKNLSVEFYCLLRFELLSPRCKMTYLEKNLYVKEMLNCMPWKLLKCKRSTRLLSQKYKILILLCLVGLWQPAMKIVYGRE